MLTRAQRAEERRIARRALFEEFERDPSLRKSKAGHAEATRRALERIKRDDKNIDPERVARFLELLKVLLPFILALFGA